MKKNKTQLIFDYLPIANIKDNYVQYLNNNKTYYYYLEFNIDQDWINPYLIQKHMEETVNKLANLSDNYVFHLTILGFKNSKSMMNTLDTNKEKNDNDFINEYLKSKKEFIKDYKSIKYIFTVTPLKDYNKELNLPGLPLEKLTELEIYNFLFNILNLDDYNDKLDRIPKHYQEVQDPTISIPLTLTKSYIQEQDDRLIVGRTNVFQYIMTNSPAIKDEYLSLSGMITHLSNMKSDFIITLIMKNNKNGIGPLSSKRTLSKGGLVSWINAKNIYTSKNIDKLEKYINEKGISGFELSLNYALVNKNLDELIKDDNKAREIPGFEGATLVNNTYAKYPDYIGLIPGIYIKYKYSMFLSTDQFSTLLMLPKMRYDTPMIFKKKSNSISSFKFLDKSIGLPGGLIFAPPGRGKSAFLNYLYLNTIIENPNMLSLIIDFGGSYKTLTSLLNLKNLIYTDLNVSKDTFYNPFDLEFGEEISEDIINKKISVLKNFFIIAINLIEEEESILEIGLKETYKSIFTDRNKMKKNITENNVINYIEIYNKSEYKDLDSFLLSMPNMFDFINEIASNQKIRSSFDENTRNNFFSKLNNFINSSKANIFSNNSTEYFLNDHLIIDFKELALKDENLLNLMLAYVIQSKLLVFMNPKNNGKKKLLVIDEYDQFRKRSDYIPKIVSTVFKTGRKEDIHQYVISQNITDFSTDFFNTCAHLITFNPSSKNEIEKLSEITGFPMEELNALSTNLESIPGKYSEMMVFTNNAKKTRTFLQFKASKFDYYSFITTDPQDRRRRDELMKEYDGDIKKSILKMIEEDINT